MIKFNWDKDPGIDRKYWKLLGLDRASHDFASQYASCTRDANGESQNVIYMIPHLKFPTILDKNLTSEEIYNKLYLNKTIFTGYMWVRYDSLPTFHTTILYGKESQAL